MNLTLAVLTVAISACTFTPAYKGSGHFVDRGIMSADRYEINFGRVNGPSTTGFVVKQAPNELFVFGLRAASPLPQHALEKTIVSLQIVDGNGTQRVNRTEPLALWVMASRQVDGASVFYYLREPHGTYLDIVAHANYSIRLMIHEVAPSTNNLEFVAMGGGWK